MNKKTRKTKKAKKRGRYSLSKGVVERILGAGRGRSRRATIRQQLVKYIYEESNPRVFEANLNKLLTYPVTHQEFCSFSSDIGSERGIFKISENKLLCLYTSFFRVQRDKINYFILKRLEFERLYSIGDYDDAEIILRCIFDKCGVSIWYIRNHFLLLKACGRLDDLQKIYTELISTVKETATKEIIDNLFWIANSNNVTLFVNSFILKNIREYKDANIHDLVSLYSELYLPAGLYEERDISHLLVQIQGFLVVDQYVMLINWFSDVISTELVKKKSHPILSKGFIVAKMADIQSFIEDPILNILIESYVGERKVKYNDFNKLIVGKYNYGDYRSVLQLYEKKYKNIRNPLAYINLIAKAKAYESNLGFKINQSLVYELIDNLCVIYNLEKNTDSAISKLHELAIKTSHFNYTYFVILGLLKACQAQFKSNNITYVNAGCYIKTTEITPYTADQILAKNSGKNHFFRSVNCQSKEQLPLYRELKNKIYKFNLEGKYNSSLISQLENEEILKKDLYETKIMALLSASMFTEAIEYSSNILINEPESSVCFPLARLVDLIEENSIVSFHSAIICYFYNMNIAIDKEYLVFEIVEDIINFKNFERPSQLLESIKISLSKVERYFFSVICTREVIDYMACYKDSVDLASERLKIIGLLGNNRDSRKFLSIDEEDKIVEEIVIETSVAKIDSSKIQVNTEGVKKLSIPEVEMLISTYYQLPESFDNEKEYLIYDENDKESPLAMVVGDRNSVLLRVLERIRHTFLYDENYGLDKNISTEIRHGFFSNLMRSKLEEAHILLEADSNNKYKSKYWEERNSFLTKRANELIIKRLASFSISFNKLLKEAENKLKISILFDEKDKLFHYLTTADDVSELRQFVEMEKTAPEVIDYIIDLLWRKTEQCLVGAREFINESFQDSIDSLFGELTENINESKGLASLVDLTNAILQAKNGIREDIKTVSEWLKREEYVSFDDTNLSFVVEIAMQSFNKIKGTKLDLDLDFPKGKDVTIPEKHVKPVVLTLINSFNNVLKHGDPQKNTTINIKVIIDCDSYTIEVKNLLTEEKHNALSDSGLDEVRKRMTSEQSKHLISTEGGSGLMKSYHSLKAIDNNFNIDINIDTELQFILGVSYVN